MIPFKPALTLKNNIKKLANTNLKLSPLTERISEWALSDEGKQKQLAASGLMSTVIAGNGTLLTPVLKEDADGFLRILENHSAFTSGKEWLPPDRIAYIDQFKKGDDFDKNLSFETASILVAGLQAVSYQKTDIQGYYDALLMTALAADEHSLELRKMITDSIPGWKPVFPTMDKVPPFIIPGREIECVGALRTGLQAAGNMFSQANSVLPEIDILSISGIQPASGGCGIPVSIFGNFAPTKPEQAFVAFPGQDGKHILVSIEDIQWSASRIDTIVPERVGDGTVGIVTHLGQPDGGDPSQALQFSEALASCLGPGAYGIASGLGRQVWASSQIQMPNIDLNPAGSNLFHGGPLLVRVVNAEMHDTDHILVEGLNLLDGDNVAVDGILCHTVLSGNILEGFTENLTMRGGLRDVKIFRGPCSSQTGIVRMLPRVDYLRNPRGTPGGVFTFDGACFSENDITATIGNIRTSVHLKDAGNGKTINVSIPNNLVPVKPDPGGEEYEIILYDRGMQLGTTKFSVIVETYRIVALGDSIMWGQGLLESQKFTELIGQKIASRPDISNGRNVYRQDRSANSGATIVDTPDDLPCKASPSVFDVAAPGLPVNFEGEKNCGASSVTTQLGEWANIDFDTRSRVDLVLIDGGINDFGVTNILSPFTLDSEVYNSAAIFCSQMGFKIFPKSGAGSVLDVFPNATIVVLGYYPIVSKNSDPLMIMRLINYITYDTIPLLSLYASLILKDSLVTKSKIFSERANEVLSGVVTATNDPRVKFAMPQWNDDNGVFAPDSFLFGLMISGIISGTAEDPVAVNRIPLCNTPCFNTKAPPTSSTCSIASLGHPNAKGAQAYADAIMQVL